MRYIAPAGTPIELRDIKEWLSNLSSSEAVLETFKQEICRAYDVKHCFFVSTGRAALTLLLHALRELSGSNRDEVLIPSYTCFSVPASIAKAGLRITVCDSDPSTLDYDYRRLAGIDFNKVLCILASNLYGIPDDLRKLCEISRKNDIYLVDDAAQCMGGKVDGRFSGTFGTAGIYSLDKGKNITSIDGGILVTNSDDLASLFKSKADALSITASARNAAYFAKLIFYAIFLNPGLYWIPEKIPWLNLGRTVYSTAFPIESYSRLLAPIGLSLFRRINEVTRARTNNAQYLRDHLDNVPFLKLPEYKEYAEPVFLRFPILVSEKDARERIVQQLNAQGIGATKSYPSPITDIEEIKGIVKKDRGNGGTQIAGQIITLPTHPLVKEKDLKAMAATVRQICKSI